MPKDAGAPATALINWRKHQWPLLEHQSKPKNLKRLYEAIKDYLSKTYKTDHAESSIEKAFTGRAISQDFRIQIEGALNTLYGVNLEAESASGLREGLESSTAAAQAPPSLAIGRTSGWELHCIVADGHRQDLLKFEVSRTQDPQVIFLDVDFGKVEIPFDEDKFVQIAIKRASIDALLSGFGGSRSIVPLCLEESGASSVRIRFKSQTASEATWALDSGDGRPMHGRFSNEGSELFRIEGGVMPDDAVRIRFLLGNLHFGYPDGCQFEGDKARVFNQLCITEIADLGVSTPIVVYTAVVK